MKTFRTQFTFLFAVSLLSDPFLARGFTVYDTFGLEDAYDHNNAALMAGPDSPFGLFSSGFLFTPSVSAYLDTLELPVGGISGNGCFALSLHRADRAYGRPGTLLETFSHLTQEGTIITVNSVSRPVLEAGYSYWIVGVGEGDSAVSWQCNSLGLRGSFYSVQAGREVLLSDQWITAFRISGTVVPEPSGAALIVLGGVSLALVSWKRSAGRMPNKALQATAAAPGS
jgi:hypothetical protein